MKKCMLGKKIGMTQVFNEDGDLIPITVISAGPLSVVQKKTEEIDGYNSIKVGYSDIPAKRSNKPEKGQFEKAKVPVKKYMRELKLEDISGFDVGNVIKVEDMFKDGDIIDVSGKSKGKGVQGTLKRFHTARGRMTHGSGYHRGLGSMGAHSDPSRIFKGKVMPGHMGYDKVTIQNLKIVKVDVERGLLLVRGAVPGPKGGLLVIKNSVKA